MKWRKLLTLTTLVVSLLASLPAWAGGEFEWMSEFNLRAEADLANFQARLAARFRVGEPQIQMVLSQVTQPAEAYLYDLSPWRNVRKATRDRLRKI